MRYEDLKVGMQVKVIYKGLDPWTDSICIVNDKSGPSSIGIMRISDHSNDFGRIEPKWLEHHKSVNFLDDFPFEEAPDAKP
jgi:hypothetical protein